MYIKTKCCFLKEGVDPKILEKYGFITTNNGITYHKDIDMAHFIMWYAETRRFVVKYPKTTSYKKICKYLSRLVMDNLIQVRPIYEWLAIMGKWQNYSPEKRERIEKELDRRTEALKNKKQKKGY